MLMLYLQAILLCCSFVIGFLISIPIGLNKSDYDGSCLLYAQIDKHGNKIKQGPLHFEFKNFKPGSAATCNFCIFTGAISLILAVVLLCGTIFFIVRNYQLRINVRLMNTGWRSYGKPVRKPMIGAWVNFCASTGVTLLLFITACFISFGFHTFCEDGIEEILHEVKSCDHLEQYVGPFYKHLYLAQISAWLGCVVWVFLSVIGWFRVRQLNPKNKSFMNNTQITEDQYDVIDPPNDL